MSVKQLSDKVFQDPAYFIAFGFGTGLIPFAPGTFGSLAAIPIFLLMASLPLQLYILLTILFFLIGTWVCNRVSRELGVHDYSGIVWDEVVGVLFSLIAVPRQWIWLLIGFLLFRLFDIWKPFPISWVDKRVKGGFGIMFDDLLAAIPTWLILQMLLWSFQK